MFSGVNRALSSAGWRAEAFLREHAVFLLLLAGYLLSTAAYFAFLGRSAEWTIRPAYPLWAISALTFSAGRLLVARLHRRASSPLWTPEAVVGAALVLAAVVPFQTTFSSVKRTIDDVRGFPWDPALAQLDRLVHFGRHPWQWLQWIVEDRALLFLIDRLYLWWFPAVSLFLFWLAWTPHRRLRQRALISTVLIWAVGGNLLALMLASAGPCYYRHADPARVDPYERLLATLDLHARSGEYVQARVVQRMLWHTATEDPIAPLRGVSAMPSMHVAMAVLMALTGWTRSRIAGVLLWGFAAVTMVGSVVLGWHYALDGYVGAVLAWTVWRCTPALQEAVSPEPAERSTPGAADPVASAIRQG